MQGQTPSQGAQSCLEMHTCVSEVRLQGVYPLWCGSRRAIRTNNMLSALFKYGHCFFFWIKTRGHNRGGNEKADPSFSTCMLFSNKLFYKQWCVSAVSSPRAWSCLHTGWRWDEQHPCPGTELGYLLRSRAMWSAGTSLRVLHADGHLAEEYSCAAGWDVRVSVWHAEGCSGHCLENIS